MQGYLSRIPDGQLRELGEFMLTCRIRAHEALRERARQIIGAGHSDAAAERYRQAAALYKEFSEVSRDIAAAVMTRNQERPPYQPRHARPR